MYGGVCVWGGGGWFKGSWSSIYIRGPLIKASVFRHQSPAEEAQTLDRSKPSLYAIHPPPFLVSPHVFVRFIFFMLPLLVIFNLDCKKRKKKRNARLSSFIDAVCCCSKCDPVFPPPLQSTSGMTQVGLHPQGVRLLRSSAVPQASSDVFSFPQTACSLEQNFTVDDVNTPKVGPVVCLFLLLLFFNEHGLQSVCDYCRIQVFQFGGHVCLHPENDPGPCFVSVSSLFRREIRILCVSPRARAYERPVNLPGCS